MSSPAETTPPSDPGKRTIVVGLRLTPTEAEALRGWGTRHGLNDAAAARQGLRQAGILPR